MSEYKIAKVSDLQNKTASSVGWNDSKNKLQFFKVTRNNTMSSKANATKSIVVASYSDDAVIRDMYLFLHSF